MKIKLIATIALLFIVIVFMLQNAADVAVKFLFWEIVLPRSLLLFVTLIIGIVVGWFVRAMYRISRAR